MHALRVLALSLPVAVACAPLIAGAGAGVLISQEVNEAGVRAAHVEVDVEIAWAAAQAIMNERAWKIRAIHDFPRRIIGDVGAADVEVQVEAYDLGRSVIRVEAEKYMVSHAKTAQEIMDAIIARLNEQGPPASR